MKSRITPLLLMATLVSPPCLAAPLTPAAEARLLSRVRNKWQQYASKYRGDFSRRSTVIKEYDPDTNKLKQTKEVRADFFNYLHKPPFSHVVSCKVDGKKADLGECKPRGKRKIFHHVFGRDGQKHYAVKIVGTSTIRGLDCYKIKVTAKKKTDRHFKGYLYLQTRDLRLVLMEGMVASLPFPLKEFWLKLLFKEMPSHPGVAVVSSGQMTMRIKVPMFVNMRAQARFRAWGHRLIKR